MPLVVATKYTECAEVLASQGRLAMAMQYLVRANAAQLSHEGAVLQERIFGGDPRNQQAVPPEQHPPFPFQREEVGVAKGASHHRAGAVAKLDGQIGRAGAREEARKPVVKTRRGSQNRRKMPPSARPANYTAPRPALRPAPWPRAARGLCGPAARGVVGRHPSLLLRPQDAAQQTPHTVSDTPPSSHAAPGRRRRRR